MLLTRRQEMPAEVTLDHLLEPISRSMRQAPTDFRLNCPLNYLFIAP
ncbi:hypothetical protein FHR34_004397 [Kitasatospora kifunensis]|uniref:Uncharacterized protein n=1 Tax=Kitasatospora kifunensis TaxID=58351 RepID=A0A7W7R4X3_KITKI|nr:hypothetical protein [Kitasatospora kifunensis]